MGAKRELRSSTRSDRVSTESSTKKAKLSNVEISIVNSNKSLTTKKKLKQELDEVKQTKPLKDLPVVNSPSLETRAVKFKTLKKAKELDVSNDASHSSYTDLTPAAGKKIAMQLQKQKQFSNLQETNTGLYMFMDRLAEFRLLPKKDQNKLFYELKSRAPPPYRCLTSSCSATYSTVPGLQYHLRICGIPISDQYVNCDKCGCDVRFFDIERHNSQYHNNVFSVKMELHSSESEVGLGKRRSAILARQNFANLEENNDDYEYNASGEEFEGVSGACSLSPPGSKPFSEVSDDSDTESNAGQRSTSITEAASVVKRFDPNSKRLAIYTKHWSQNFRIQWQNFHDNQKIGAVHKHWFSSCQRNLTGTLIESLPDDYFSTTELRELRLFQSHKASNGSLIFVGGTVLAIAWLPMLLGVTVDDRFACLAVASYPNASLEHGRKVPSEKQNALIQIYVVVFDDEFSSMQSISLKCILDIGSGAPIWSIKWHPSPLSDPLYDLTSTVYALAIARNSGEADVICVSSECLTSKDARVLHSEATVKCLSPECQSNVACFCVCWCPFSPISQLLAGYSNGSLAIFEVLEPVQSFDDGQVGPLLVWNSTRAPIRDVQWISGDKIVSFSADCVLRIYQLIRSETADLQQHCVYHLDTKQTLTVPAGAFMQQPFPDFVGSNGCVFKLVGEAEFQKSTARTSSTWAPVWHAVASPSRDIFTCDDSGWIRRVACGNNLSKKKRAFCKALLSTDIDHVCAGKGLQECFNHGCNLRFKTCNFRHLVHNAPRALIDVECPLSALFQIDYLELTRNSASVVAAGGLSGFVVLLRV